MTWVTSDMGRRPSGSKGHGVAPAGPAAPCPPNCAPARAGHARARRSRRRANALPAAARRATMRARPLPQRPGSSPMPRTVLIVDDERDTNDMLAGLVQSRGFEPIQLFEGARVFD